MRDLAIQIVNYRTRSYLTRCLETLLHDLARASFNYAINILDNASGDDLSELEEKYRSTGRVTFLKNNHNVGFGAGHNILARQANARFILILNPDIEFMEPRSIERLLGKLISEPRVAAVGPRLVTGPNKTQQWWDHGELRGWKAWLTLNAGDSYWKERRDASEAAWVSGAAFLIRKDVFDDVGGFDQKFFLYKEEEDLFWRIRERGRMILYDPSITIFHHGGVVAKKEDHIDKSRAYFRQKHIPITYPVFAVLEKIFKL